MNIKSPSKLIALTGGSGAGKSWLADRLCQEFGGEAATLSLDDFYRDLSHLRHSEREKSNFDHPDAIDWPLFQGVLSKLQDGEMALTPSYNFASHTRLTGLESCRPRPLTFVDGLWLLWPPQVRVMFGFRIFLDCPEALRWQRRLARDGAERGRTTDSIHEQFWNVVAPMHERYVEVQKSWADLVIEQPISPAGFAGLVATIRALGVSPCPTPLESAPAWATTPRLSATQSL